jgi:hypothetical protein
MSSAQLEQQEPGEEAAPVAASTLPGEQAPATAGAPPAAAPPQRQRSLEADLKQQWAEAKGHMGGGGDAPVSHQSGGWDAAILGLHSDCVDVLQQSKACLR